MGELDGGIVLVTGAARGIGRVTAPLGSTQEASRHG